MASITSLSNSSYNTNSIYGNRNVLSGLASGMDTESMIENAVSGIKMKISSLQQKRTKLEWQQEDYRSIIDKLVNFERNYSSYLSSTNLMSNSFFNNAVLTTAKGKFADNVSATGKTSSDIALLGVKQLATAATYRKTGLGKIANDPNAGVALEGETVNLSEILPQSKVEGSMTIKYGTRTFDLSFDGLETYDTVGDFAAAIREKLGEITTSDSAGNSKKASDMVSVNVQDGNIVFGDAQNAGNSVVISSASGKIKDTLGIDTSAKSGTLHVSGKELVDNTSRLGEYLSGREINVTLNGVTKKITLPEYTQKTYDDTKDQKGTSVRDFMQGIQTSLDKAFGEGKITVQNIPEADAEGSAMTFGLKAQEGSTVSVSGKYAEAMGLGKGGSANYLDTGKKLSDLMDTDSIEGWDEDGKKDLVINGVKIGSYGKDTTLESIMTAINSNPDAGVKVSYSKTTNQFQFTAGETGEAGKIEFEGLAQDLFGDPSAVDDNGNRVYGAYENGQDAIFSMEVNGQKYDGIKRSSNTFDVDGLTMTLKDTFGYAEGEDKIGEDNWAAAKKDAVTFESTSDADKIVDAIKNMVNDYNEMITEIKNAYSTMPATKSNGSRYEPLTEDDEANMSETAIKNYEEKARQGILFGDSNLSRLYDQLRNAITPGGNDGQTLREIGINTNYSNGLTTISLDETALRNTLANDPDKVRNAFTKSADSGAATNGLMQTIQKTLDTYSKTTGEPKGVLITHAGSVKAPTSLNSNSLLSQMNSIDTQIERWQDKMSDQVDRYTTKFSKLEQLIAQMNSQAESLAGLMGGY